jgi:hypothetical protein
MNKLTIILIIIAIVFSGVGGFILGAQNSQMIPAVNIVNNTTDDNYTAPKYTYNTTKKVNTTKTQTESTPTPTPTPVNNSSSTK